MKNLFALAKPFLHSLDPETAHKATIAGLKLLPPLNPPHSDPILRQNVFGLSFAHPLGLAAGFDKNAETMRAMLSLGMSHVEIGTVTPLPQAGNPAPRVFRSAQDAAVINRMGFPNGGADAFFANLHAYRKAGGTGIIGVNIGKNKDTVQAVDDYALLAKRAQGLASYLTINISSPNTPGLRDLQNGEFLKTCVAAVRECYRGPVLVKLAPDIDEALLSDLGIAALAEGVDGLIVTNTTLDRPAHLESNFAKEKGGLSGAPLKDKALEILRGFYGVTNGKIPLIGAGGIASAEDAYRRIRAGASLLQVYTGLVFKGPDLIGEITRELPQKLRKDGFETLGDAIGADHR